MDDPGAGEERFRAFERAAHDRLATPSCAQPLPGQASKIVAWRWPRALERMIEPSYMAVSIGLAFREAALSVHRPCDLEGSDGACKRKRGRPRSAARALESQRIIRHDVAPN